MLQGAIDTIKKADLSYLNNLPLDAPDPYALISGSTIDKAKDFAANTLGGAVSFVKQAPVTTALAAWLASRQPKKISVAPHAELNRPDLLSGFHPSY
jgi:hypothetical protein